MAEAPLTVEALVAALREAISLGRPQSVDRHLLIRALEKRLSDKKDEPKPQAEARSGTIHREFSFSTEARDGKEIRVKVTVGGREPSPDDLIRATSRLVANIPSTNGGKPHMGQVMAECDCRTPNICLPTSSCTAEALNVIRASQRQPGILYWLVAELDELVARMAKAGFRGTINHALGKLTIR